MKTKFYRVTIKTGKGKTSSFWAERLKKTPIFTLYRKVNNEGEDFGYYRKKDGVLIDKQDLISNDLIISEKPAVEDRKYGTLKVVKK